MTGHTLAAAQDPLAVIAAAPTTPDLALALVATTTDATIAGPVLPLTAQQVEQVTLQRPTHPTAAPLERRHQEETSKTAQATRSK